MLSVGKPAMQDNTMSCYELGRIQDLHWEKIAGLFIPQDLFNMYSNNFP